MASEYHICFAGTNPTADGLSESESAARAASENDRNGSLTMPVGDVGPMVPTIEPQSLAVFMGKFWAPGRQLRISFLAGNDWQKEKVKQYAPLWCKHANLSMKFVDRGGDVDILIDFNPSLGSWSNIGTDSGYPSSKGKASMNLGWINKDQKEENIRQVILHEFGHALGAVHEHESPFAKIPWNKPRVYKDLGGPPNNWDKAKVDGNMFTLYGLDKAEGSPFDEKSIMLYHYPAEWTTNNHGTPFNTDLSDKDKSYIHFFYPPKDSDAGHFSTLELHPADKPALENKKTKMFWKKYPAAPRVAVGLTSLDVGHAHNIRISASASDINQEKFTANLHAWNDTILYGASLAYLEAGPDFEHLRIGSFSTTEVGKWQDHKPLNSKRINFKRPFDAPPKVICWLTTVDMDKDKNWRIKAYVSDVDSKGFTAHIDTWGDTIMYQAAITWIAYPSNQSKVASGHFSTDDVRSWDKPQQENSATVKFAKPFGGRPKLGMGLTGFDYDHTKNLRLRLSTSGVTKEAVTWHLQTWLDSGMYRASASYFAWE